MARPSIAMSLLSTPVRSLLLLPVNNRMITGRKNCWKPPLSVRLHHIVGMIPNIEDKTEYLNRNTSERLRRTAIAQCVTDMDCVFERKTAQHNFLSEIHRWIKNLVRCLPATPGAANAALNFCTPLKILVLCVPRIKMSE